MIYLLDENVIFLSMYILFIRKLITIINYVQKLLYNDKIKQKYKSELTEREKKEQ